MVVVSMGSTGALAGPVDGRRRRLLELPGVIVVVVVGVGVAHGFGELSVAITVGDCEPVGGPRRCVGEKNLVVGQRKRSKAYGQPSSIMNNKNTALRRWMQESTRTGA